LSPRCSPGFYSTYINVNGGRYPGPAFSFHADFSVISVITVSFGGTTMIQVHLSSHVQSTGALCKVGTSTFETTANSSLLHCPRGDPGVNTSVCISVNSGYDWSNCVEVLSDEPNKKENFSFSCVASVSPKLQKHRMAFVNITFSNPSMDYQCSVRFNHSQSLSSFVVPVLDNFCSFNLSDANYVTVDVTKFNVSGCSVFSYVFEETKCSVTSSRVTVGESVFVLCPPNVPFESCRVENIEIPVQVVSNGLFACTMFNVSSGPKLLQLVSSSGHFSSSSEIVVHAHDRVYSVIPSCVYVGVETKFIFTGSFAHNKQYTCLFESRFVNAVVVTDSELFCAVQISDINLAVASICISSRFSTIECIHEPHKVSIRYPPTITDLTPSVISVNNCRPFSIKMSAFLDSPNFILKVGQVTISETSINRASGAIEFSFCFLSTGQHVVSVYVEGNLNLRTSFEIAVINLQDGTDIVRVPFAWDMEARCSVNLIESNGTYSIRLDPLKV